MKTSKIEFDVLDEEINELHSFKRIGADKLKFDRNSFAEEIKNSGIKEELTKKEEPRKKSWFERLIESIS